DQWITHVKHIGKGLPALQYLSRYLYRGVLSEKAIVKTDATHVTFRYQDSQTRKMTTRSLNGEDFIWKLLTHVLPRRFRRVRDFGFLVSAQQSTRLTTPKLCFISAPSTFHGNSLSTS